VTPTTKARALALGLGAMFSVCGGVIGLVALYALVLTRDLTLIVGVVLSGTAASLGWVILTRTAVDFTANATGLTLGFVRGGVSVPWSDVRGWTYLACSGWEMLDLRNPDPDKYEAKAILTVVALQVSRPQPFRCDVSAWSSSVGRADPRLPYFAR